jgi:hypothetical protein
MTFRLAGTDLHTFDVEAVESDPKIYEIRVKVEAGKQRFAAAYINNYLNPKDPNPKNRDRNLIIHYLEVEGPLRRGATAVAGKPPPVFTRQPTPETKIDRPPDPEQLLPGARIAGRRQRGSGPVDKVVRDGDKDGESFENA